MLPGAVFGSNGRPSRHTLKRMPNLTLTVPADAFDAATRQRLLQAVHDAAVRATGLGPEPAQQRLCWVMLQEIAAGHWLCGGQDIGARAIPCQIEVRIPQGVLDARQRADYARQLHEAIAGCLPSEDTRVLLGSILMTDVADGHWAVNGQLWQVSDFVRSAGYAHLQSQAAPA